MARRKVADADPGPDETKVEGPADPPVYDERGNVRPRGTEGARPMSYEERVEIALAIQSLPQD